MKRGRTGWTAKCGRELLRRVKEAADACDLSARDIYDKFNLARFVKSDAFDKWCQRRRRERENRQAERFGFNQSGKELTAENAENAESTEINNQDSSAASATSAVALPEQPIDGTRIDLVIAQCVEAISEALATGRLGKLDVGKALRSLAALKELCIAEAAEKRAQELHEIKLADLRSKMKAAVDKETGGGTKSVTRDDVYQLVDDIMRGKA